MRHTLNAQDKQDILIGAIEGGINYWAAVDKYDPDAVTATIHEFEPSDTGYPYFVLTEKDIERGYYGLLYNDNYKYSGLDLDNLDSFDYDAIIQQACFHEVRYG